MNKVAVIGSGYVGLAVGTCLADLGNTVTCVDNNKDKINALKQGDTPIYEAGIKEMIKRNADMGRLRFTADTNEAVNESDIIFIAVGTPPLEDGSADIKQVLEVSRQIGRLMEGYKVIVIKSTVPIGTGQKVKEAVRSALKERGAAGSFDVVSNPEFLREGSAIHDFLHTDRIVLGVESPKAEEIMKDIYESMSVNGTPILFTNIETAELIKYGSNAFLAMKITFINELAQLCEKVGADVFLLAQGIGMDKRIGPDFLKPGPGYGGSCFPKDTCAIVKTGRDQGVSLSLIEQTINANEKQKLWMVKKIKEKMGSLEGKTFGILGITFKAETDDMRDAPSLLILQEMAKDGARLRIYDPQGEKEGKLRLESIKESIEFCADEYEAAYEADALVILTDWVQFMTLDMDKIFGVMKGSYFFDLRNMFDRSLMAEKGFLYSGIGR